MSIFKVGYNISGAKALADKLKLTGKALSQAENTAVDRIAIAVVNKAQDYAGRGHPSHPNVITGNLRASINWRHKSQGTAEVGTNLDYALWVEFGHMQEPGRYVPAIGARLVESFSPAYPFFRPALNEIIDSGEAMKIIVQVFQQAVLTQNGGEGAPGIGGGVVSDVEDLAAVAEL